MIALRRHPFTRTLAGLLIAALTAAMAPQDAWVSRAVEPPPVTIHADGIGSVRTLTDETGAVTDTYTYTAFGELLSHTGTDPQPYAFAGEPYDPNAGFQYHRARWMDPRTGRFVGMDIFGVIAADPRTLHRYAYAALDPINTSDPSGLLFSNLVWGRAVHAAIGSHFRNQDPTNRFADVSLNTILGTQVLWYGLMRPDLVDRQVTEVFEIKPWGSYVDGQVQLTFYLSLLNAVDPQQRRWIPGTASTYTPPRVVPITWGVVAHIHPPEHGVIMYEVTDYRTIALVTLAVIAGSMSMAQLQMHTGVATTNALMGRVA